MLIVIGFEDRYRSYADFIADAIRQARPNAEVAVSEAGTLEEEIGRTDPHLVTCGLPVPANPVGERAAWVGRSLDPDEPSRFQVGERRRESLNPSLEHLLLAVDEAERLTGEDRDPP